MKICFTICEFNPFHNGHLLLFREIREKVRPDATVVVMSGNFTQRGDAAVLGKFVRASEAIEAGADAVVELPTVFATAPAEIFAKGAIKLINAIDCEKVLCFGAENADKKKISATANALLNESKEFKKLYKEELKTGVTPVKAKINALAELNIEDVDLSLLKSPNNILAVEYAKAAISSGGEIGLHPFQREGGAYNDETLLKDLSSATAIRKAIKEGKIKKVKSCVPPYVYRDLGDIPSADDLIYYSLLRASRTELQNVLDCGEGLENRIKALVGNCESVDALLDKLKTKRYTYTRLKRIILSCMLGISSSLVAESMKSPLYLKVLAVKKDSKILSELSARSAYPLITRKKDADLLTGGALKCFEKDVFANDVYNYISGKRFNEYDMKII